MTRSAALLGSLAFALTVGGCSSLLAVGEPVRLSEPFWLGLSEMWEVSGLEAGIRFLDVLEDSRCPTGPGIACVWAGRVRIRVQWVADISATHELRYMDEPSSAMQGNFRIELLGIAPEARSPGPPGTGYRVRLRIVLVAPPSD